VAGQCERRLALGRGNDPQAGQVVDRRRGQLPRDVRLERFQAIEALVDLVGDRLAEDLGAQVGVGCPGHGRRLRVGLRVLGRLAGHQPAQRAQEAHRAAVGQQAPALASPTSVSSMPARRPIGGTIASSMIARSCSIPDRASIAMPEYEPRTGSCHGAVSAEVATGETYRRRVASAHPYSPRGLDRDRPRA
jgi:hypothetical protein